MRPPTAGDARELYDRAERAELEVARLRDVLRSIADDPAESSQMYEWTVRRLARDALVALDEELARG